jgi:GDSL-like Lipase/Acylhydrolase family
MRLFGTIMLVLLTLTGLARADEPAECRAAEHLVQNDFPLPRASKALDAKRLDILVLGGGSSMLPGASESKAYPSRLQNVLAQKLPNISIKVTVDTKSRRNAAEALRTIPQDLATAKPNLVVWQAGVSDAMQGVDPEAFSATLNKGVETAHAAAADVILMNTQYSPRTASMIALSTYLENMHWVALQREVPLFDRFRIMELWSELGTFNLFSATNELDTAERVHDCIARLLADLIVEAAKPAAPAVSPKEN